MTCQVSLMFACARGNSMVRLIGLPLASRRGLSAGFDTLPCPPPPRAVAPPPPNRPFSVAPGPPPATPYFPVEAVAPAAETAWDNPRAGPPGGRRGGPPKPLGSILGAKNPPGGRPHTRLCKTPGRTRIGCCDRLDDLIEGGEIDGGAAERNRQQHVEQAASMHRRQDIGRNLPFLLGAAGSGLDHRRQGTSPRQPILTVLGQQRSPPAVFTSLAQGKPPVGSRWRLGFPSTSIAAAP